MGPSSGAEFALWAWLWSAGSHQAGRAEGWRERAAHAPGQVPAPAHTGDVPGLGLASRKGDLETKLCEHINHLPGDGRKHQEERKTATHVYRQQLRIQLGLRED